MRHPAQEPDRVEGRLIVVVLAGVIVASTVGVLGARWIERGRGEGTRALSMPVEVNAIETRPFGDAAEGLEEHRAAEAWLSSYGWVDREAGLIHVPIDVAIDLYLARQRAPAGSPP